MGRLSQAIAKPWDMTDVPVSEIVADFIEENDKKISAAKQDDLELPRLKESNRLFIFYTVSRAWLRPKETTFKGNRLVLWELFFPLQFGKKFKNGPIAQSPFKALEANWKLNRHAPGFLEKSGEGQGSLATQEPGIQ